MARKRPIKLLVCTGDNQYLLRSASLGDANLGAPSKCPLPQGSTQAVIDASLDHLNLLKARARSASLGDAKRKHRNELLNSLSTYKVNLGDSLETPLECFLTKYATLADFLLTHNLALPKERYTGFNNSWRLVNATVGHFRACPKMRGVACATNGIDLFVERGDGVVVKGHLYNWIEDNLRVPSEVSGRPASLGDAKLKPTPELNESRKKTLANLLAECL